MASPYAHAVRKGALAAARLQTQLGIRDELSRAGGGVDVFEAIHRMSLPLLLRPLQTLLGAYVPEPVPGVLVTTRRPLSIQRFTAAHEFGHFHLQHQPSLDDESILRRMLATNGSAASAPLEEVEADAFAVAFLTPRWLIEWHCQLQGWLASSLTTPLVAYQLSLRLGISYEAVTWTLQRYDILSTWQARDLREVQPKAIKLSILRDYQPAHYRGDAWLLTERDAGTRIDGSRDDCFVLQLSERSGAGYLWNVQQLQESGFAIVGDFRNSSDPDGVGGPATRTLTAAVEEPRRGTLRLAEARPWQPAAPISEFAVVYDLTGPEEAGLSRAEKRHLLEAA